MTEIDRRAALKGGAAMAAFLPAACAQAPASVVGASEPAAMDGVRMAEAVAAGEITALELTEGAIARAEAVNPEINAIASADYDAARERAGEDLTGAYAGAPTFMKDLIDWKGAPTYFGSRAFKTYVAAEDGPFAAQWRAAGMVSLGKSTTPEMGLISSTEPLVTGPTRNPWNTGRIPGGSSGGAAALVAARVTPFAHASDGGGSIRIPAAACGLFGMKPSRARLGGTRAGDPPPVDISVNHAVTLTVRDSVALFRAAERLDGGYEPLGEISGPSTRRLKIGFAPEASTGAAVHADTRAELEAAADLCRDLGHEVVEFVPPMDGETFIDQFLMYWASGAAQFAADAAAFSGKPVGPEIVEPWTLGLMRMYLSRQDEMGEVVAYLKGFEAAYEAWFEEMDVLLTPTVSAPAPAIGSQDPAGDYEAVMANVVSWAAFTAPMNVAGAASMSVPLGMSGDGLPIGAMFSAKRGEDGKLFELAYELEAAAPWIGRRPPVAAA
ncbi:MAG: amidase [Pseudomonadota bacterium]